MKWRYGIVEIKEGRKKAHTEICEIYFNRGKLMGIVELTEKDVVKMGKAEFAVLTRDCIFDLKHNIYYKYDGKTVELI